MVHQQKIKATQGTSPSTAQTTAVTTLPSPWSTTVASMLVASDDATAGSVMAKQDRMSPFKSGVNHSSWWDEDPYRRMVSMLPVSGALQLKISGATRLRPVISAMQPYSRFVNPAPLLPATLPMASSVSLGKNRFQRFKSQSLEFL